MIFLFLQKQWLWPHQFTEAIKDLWNFVVIELYYAIQQCIDNDLVLTITIFLTSKIVIVFTEFKIKTLSMFAEM